MIDPSTGTIYVVAKTKEVSGATTSYVQRLHALDLTTGAEKAGSPVVIQASVPGTGNGSSGGTLAFNSLRQNQRAALALVNGVVYIGFSSHGDNEPFHGWVLGYNASTLQRVMVFCTTPNSENGGVWMDGDGVATDSTGSLYFISGDGDLDANTGGNDYGDSFLRLSTSGTVQDYFSPSVQSTLDANNLDLGAGGVLLLPDQSGAHPHEMLSAGKNGTIYLVDRDNMGHFNSSIDQIVQELVNIFPNNLGIEGGNFSSPVYWNGSVYFAPVARYRAGVQADERPTLDEPDVEVVADIHRARWHHVDLRERLQQRDPLDASDRWTGRAGNPSRIRCHESVEGALQQQPGWHARRPGRMGQVHRAGRR